MNYHSDAVPTVGDFCWWCISMGRDGLFARIMDTVREPIIVSFMRLYAAPGTTVRTSAAYNHVADELTVVGQAACVFEWDDKTFIDHFIRILSRHSNNTEPLYDVIVHRAVAMVSAP